MKNVVALILFSIFALSVNAQIARVEQSIWGHGTPIIVNNETNQAVMARLGEAEVFIPAGGSHTWHLGRGVFIFEPHSSRLTVSARVCSSVQDATQENAPPTWATDPKSVGGLALTPEYLRPDLPQKDLEGRVKAIKELLDKQDLMGRENAKEALTRWFKTVKKDGLGPRPMIICKDPIPAGYRTIGISHNHNRHNSFSFFVREERGRRRSGYKFVGR